MKIASMIVGGIKVFRADLPDGSHKYQAVVSGNPGLSMAVLSSLIVRDYKLTDEDLRQNPQIRWDRGFVPATGEEVFQVEIGAEGILGKNPDPLKVKDTNDSGGCEDCEHKAECPDYPQNTPAPFPYPIRNRNYMGFHRN